MTKHLAFCCIALLLSACETRTITGDRPEQAFTEPVYSMDRDTGLCFAERGNGFSEVPCTPKVRALVGKDRRVVQIIISRTPKQ